MGGYTVELLLLATVSVLLGISQQTVTACPLQCPYNCTNQDECCPTGQYWPAGSSDNDTQSTASPFQCVPIPCSDKVDYCVVCRFNWTSEEVVCSECEDPLKPSAHGDSCDPPADDTTLPVWLIPVVVVGGVIVVSAVVGVVVLVVVRRCRRTSRVRRPQLPRPDQLDDLPEAFNQAAKKRSIVDRFRNRYAQTPNGPQQGVAAIGKLRDRVQSVDYEKRDDVLHAPASSSPTSATSQKSPRPAAPEPVVSTDRRSRTKKPTTPIMTGPAQEIYANYCAPEDGEVYANENIELQPTVASDLPRVATDDDEEVQEEYQNVEEVSRTASQRSPLNDDDDGQQIYENVSRKPTPAPKPRRNF